jgi:hypothetical protein
MHPNPVLVEVNEAFASSIYWLRHWIAYAREHRQLSTRGAQRLINHTQRIRIWQCTPFSG